MVRLESKSGKQQSQQQVQSLYPLTPRQMKTIEQTYWNIIFEDKYDLEAFSDDLNDYNHDHPKTLDPYTIPEIP